MRKATKKPIEIEWISHEEFYDRCGIEGRKITNINELLPNAHNPLVEFKDYTEDKGNIFTVYTLEGNHEFTMHDVLIIGVRGEIYPCKKDIFDLTYDCEI